MILIFYFHRYYVFVFILCSAFLNIENKMVSMANFCWIPRVLLAKGRKIAQQYFLTYREHIPTRMIVRELANVMQEYTQRGYDSQLYIGVVMSSSSVSFIVIVTDIVTLKFLSNLFRTFKTAFNLWFHQRDEVTFDKETNAFASRVFFIIKFFVQQGSKTFWCIVACHWLWSACRKAFPLSSRPKCKSQFDDCCNTSLYKI